MARTPTAKKTTPPIDATMVTPDQPLPVKPKHTSVIYVHGIGSQRRYEETSRLIDSLDTYLTHQADAGTPQGLIRGIDPVMEPLRAERTGIISYIRTRLTHRPGQPVPEVRFYEIYWAPVMAEQKSPGVFGMCNRHSSATVAALNVWLKRGCNSSGALQPVR